MSNKKLYFSRTKFNNGSKQKQ